MFFGYRFLSIVSRVTYSIDGTTRSTTYSTVNTSTTQFLRWYPPGRSIPFSQWSYLRFKVTLVNRMAGARASFPSSPILAQ